MDNLLNDDSKSIVSPIYGRTKGADWFDFIYKRDVMIIGQGGIGSHLALQLSRTGANLFIYDDDHFESHNGGQVMFKSDVGKLKTQAVKGFLAEFSPDCQIHTSGIYTAACETNDIVLCGVDKMSARKTAYTNWKSYVLGLPPERRRKCFFQDGRLLAEQYQIISIAGDNDTAMARYEKDYLFGNGEAPQADCTFSQTTFCAAMIAGHMIGFLCNWLCNSVEDGDYRQVPVYHEYLLPSNTTFNS